MKRASKAKWEERVKAWKASGETAAAFARKEGISLRGLRWWRWRLNAIARDESLVKASAPTPMSVSFVEVPVEAISIHQHEEALEVVLSSRMSVRVPRGFDEKTLSTLLDVLERRR